MREAYFHRIVTIVALVSVASSAKAFAGAVVSWTTYEAEDMATTGTLLGPQYAPHLVASEASGRKCVRLNAVGDYVQFTSTLSGNAIVVRYSVPDTPDGSGTNYTLSLYTNGSFAAKLPLTSRYSWLYGAYPFTNNPAAGLPRNLYDEVRMLGLSINAGDSVRLQKDITDTANNYVIDLVDLESVASPLNAPANSLSVTSFGAVGDGITDCTSAFQNCINAAAGLKTVWVPAGTYVISATLNLPSNTTLQGAGNWYSTLIGQAALYNATPSRRLNLNGTGSNIHLADFAITGFLNYRNDTEGNDGLGGSYGTGSSISRIWVEHTKAAAWLYNSSGLVVDSCRFRNTLADGINLNRGMRNTIVTNCTARGTGDDCFAIWPSSGSQNYAPGLNVITHCTGQVPFLANGGAIYGGTSNRVEDCLFQDIPYGCGILFSTTFPVGTNVFAGTTVAQQCDLFRCGGYDEGYGWRAALQLCLDNHASGISNVQLGNLNISNSISDGLSIIGGIGRLSNAVAIQVSIPNYGLGASGRHGAWASSETVGGLVFSNSTVVEYRDDSPNFAFNFLTQITVQTSPAGRSFTVDATAYASAQTFNWTAGSPHTIAVNSPQSGGTGVLHAWNSWSDGGAISHAITPNSSATYTANFTTRYFVTMSAGAGGNASPASDWFDSGTPVNLSATPSNGYSFSGWTGSGSGSYSGSNNPASIVATAPITEVASFALIPSRILGISVGGNASVTFTYATVPGFPYHVETATNLSPATWQSIAGSATNATGSNVTFTDPHPPRDGQRFYRTASP
jgi:Alpha-1,3-glucanase catalytic domain D1/Alpha-1,3-glucanase catalytic domain D2/Divergent InlB B-repeat domain